jgi:putative flippase GtrA
MLTLKPKNREEARRLARFLVVGGGTLLVQMLVYRLLRAVTGETAAFTGSWVVSTATHYVANRFWALPSARQDAGKQFGEYLFTIAVSYAINVGAFKGLSALGLPELWALALAVPPSTVAVFLLLNYRVFRAPATATGNAVEAGRDVKEGGRTKP